MENKQNFYIYGPPQEGKPSQLNTAERNYLRKRNWVRLVQLLGLFSWASFLLLLPLVLVVSLTDHWYENGINGVAIFLISICLLVWFIVWKAWGKSIIQALKTPWWLSLDDVKAITLTGHFGTLIHPTSEDENFWTINNTVVDFPKHWELSLDKIISDFDKPKLVTFRVAKIPKASGKVLRLRMISSQYTRRRTDVVVADSQYIVLQAGVRSIVEDSKNSIPINRNNPFLVGLGTFYLIISVFLGIAWHSVNEKEQKDIKSEEYKIDNQIKSIGFERDITKQELANRDFPILSPHDKYGRQLLESDSIAYVEVANKHEATKTPFILSVNEYQLIYRLSTVSPSVILGYGNKANSKEIAVYRKQLLAIIDKGMKMPNELRALGKAKIQGMSDALIEKQMHSYGNGFRVDPNFIKKLIPLPRVEIPASTIVTPYCINKTVFCSINSNKIKRINQKNVFFTVKNGGIVLNTPNEIEYLETLKTNLIQLQKKYKHSEWLSWLTVIGFTIGLLIIILFIIAKIKAKRFYKKD